MTRQTRMWLWKLDASLPGKLGKFGDWLNQGEELMEQLPDLEKDHASLAEDYAKLCEEHKVRVIKCVCPC